jgi:hypothetical protein
MTEDRPAPTAPLEVAEFARFRSRAGRRARRIDIEEIGIEFEGLPDGIADRMAADYGPYLGSGAGGGDPLRVEVLDAPVDYFIPPDDAGARDVYLVLTALDGGAFRFLSYRLAAWIDAGRRRGQIALGRGGRDPAPRAIENLLRAAVAWMAIERGGFLLHGASIVRGGRGFLFYGPSGAGKSTLAALSDEGRVISDDLSLVLRRPAGLVVAGGPFRGTYREGAPVVGAFPVAGLYRIRKADAIRVTPGDAGCFADLVGNLPYIVDQVGRRSDLLDRVRAIAAGAALRTLEFRKDRSFWPAIDADLVPGR